MTGNHAQSCILGVWPVEGPISPVHAHNLASAELAGMCADYKVFPAGSQATVILRTLADCITAARKLGVRPSRLMALLEELAGDTPLAVAASVPVVAFYRELAA